MGEGLSKGDIQHPMQAILDAPMSVRCRQQSLSISLQTGPVVAVFHRLLLSIFSFGLNLDHRMGVPSPKAGMPFAGMSGGMPGMEMLSAGMAEAMPSAALEAGIEQELPRFPPPDQPPGSIRSPSWRPGVVEVQFREGVRPQIAAGALEAMPTLSSPADVNLGDFNQILRRRRLQTAESSFLTPALEADEWLVLQPELSS